MFPSLQYPKDLLFRKGIPLLFTEEFEVVIMIERVTEEMHGSD